VVLRDPAATAANITGNTGLFRLGFTLYLVEMAAQIAMTALFYQLLKPVHRGVALLSAIFGFVGCTIKIVARLFYIMPLLVLGAPSNTAGFSGEQLSGLGYRLFPAIALLALGGSVAMILWLLVRAVDEPRWLELARVSAASVWR